MEKVKFREGSFGFFAELDIQDMEAALETKRGTPRGCCLYAQQVIEKMFKQLRVEQGCKPGHPDLTGHNLLRLAEATKYPNRELYRRELLSLGKLYFEGRYPPESSYYMFIMPTWPEVQSAVDLAMEIYTWVCVEIADMHSAGVRNIKSMDIKKMDLTKAVDPKK